MMTLDDIKERLGALYDPDDIVEALEISTGAILDRFEDRIEMFLYKFEEELEEYCDEFQ